MRIIEFCGLPGCGKTTLCNKLEKELRGETVNRAYILDNNIMVKNYNVRMIRCCLRPSLWQFIILALRAAKVCGTSRKIIMRLIVLYDRLTYYKRKNFDKTIILEEGIIQYLSALSYEKELPMKQEVRDVIQFFFHNLKN